MLLWLSEYLINFHSGFNVLQYLTMRTILGVFVSLFFCLLTGSTLIQYLNRLQLRQQVRVDGPKSHLQKTGTPTMGGILILLAIFVSTIICADLENRFVWVVLITAFFFGAIGFYDDYLKIIHQNSCGLSARHKYFCQSIIAFLVAYFLYSSAQSDAELFLIVPFLKGMSVYLGWSYMILVYFVIVGSSNAVNLTDGLDGLAILPTVVIAGALAVFSYVSGHFYFSDYLNIPYIVGVGEVSIICASIVGAGLGFLWFNTYPAQVFMGDIGALALGSAIGVIAVIVRQEIVFFIMGGVFVIETLSVMVQVASFKLLGRRVFQMAPLHHHYELKGWPEPKIIVRFWIITVILVLIGLASLKIR